MAFWIYILRCADGSYYTGHTDNLEKRVGEHIAGTIPGCYTFKRRPLELVFFQDFPTREEALASEQQIKGWSRKKKEAMMQGNWAEVSRLAKSVRFDSSTSSEVEGRRINSVRPDSSTRSAVEGQSKAVRPEPVEGCDVDSVHKAVRPEPVEGREVDSVHGSTSSPRTE